MSDEEIDKVIHIANDIETYLKQHPDAADTLDGIIKWWVSRIRIEESVGDISKALVLLELENIVAKTRTVDGRVIYSRQQKCYSDQ